MNSMSRTHCNDDSDDRCNKHREDDCCRKHKDTEVILKCGTPNSVTIPALTAVATSFTLSSVTLNTERLCNPCIKFEFASNIITTAFTGSINFQIFKQCRNQFTPVPIGPTWTFARAVAIASADTFSFIVCDCDCNNSCPDDCCTYTVVATIGVVTAGVAAINNATLSALVVDNNCHCR